MKQLGSSIDSCQFHSKVLDHSRLFPIASRGILSKSRKPSPSLAHQSRQLAYESKMVSSFLVLYVCIDSRVISRRFLTKIKGPEHLLWPDRRVAWGMAERYPTAEISDTPEAPNSPHSKSRSCCFQLCRSYLDIVKISRVKEILQSNGASPFHP